MTYPSGVITQMLYAMVLKPNEKRDRRFQRCSNTECLRHTEYKRLPVTNLHQCGLCANLYEICDNLLVDPYRGDLTLNDE